MKVWDIKVIKKRISVPIKEVVTGEDGVGALHLINVVTPAFKRQTEQLTGNGYRPF